MKEKTFEKLLQQLVEWFERAESGKTEAVISEVTALIRAMDEGRANGDPGHRERLEQLLSFLKGEAEDPDLVEVQFQQHRDYLDFRRRREAQIRMEGFAHVAKLRAEEGKMDRARWALQRARKSAEAAGMTDSPKLLEAIRAVEGGE